MNELLVADAEWRIKELYERTNGKCIISFSGGKDSTVIADIYLKMRERGEIGYIPLVFADTQIEYQAVDEFVDWFSKNRQEVVRLKPTKTFGRVLREYGKPVISKMKSGCIATYQRAIKRGDDPLNYKCASEMISGYKTTKELEILDERSHFRLANKHFQFLHPDHETKIDQKCCYYMKKQPFERYYIENNIEGFITGMRADEGGIRAVMYKSCTAHKKVRDKTLIHKMPLFDWSGEDVDAYIEENDVKISKAYTKYGLKRTGCIGCPFAQDLENSLRALWNYEPKKYKAILHWLGDVYRDLEIQLPWDEEYMREFWKRQPVVKQRRYEMLKKYRPNIAEKYKPKHTQIKMNLSKE